MKILTGLAYILGWVFGATKRCYLSPGFVSFLMALVIIFVVFGLLLPAG